MIISGRTSSGFILPLSASYWAAYHPCRPKVDQPESTQEKLLKAKYLHNYPVPLSDIISFFGFTVETGVREIWEDKILRFSNPSERKLQDLYPGAIDFLGTYSGSDQTITIYLGSIDRFLGTEQGRGLDREAVIEVVRIHEAMHWLHHLGSVATARARLWEPLDSNLHPDFEIERDALFAKPTNIQKFVDTRTRWWESLGMGLFNKVWEFVAEVSTCIYANYVQQVHGPRLAGKPSLRNTFWQMAQNQPPEYDILPPLRDTLKEPGSWPETGGLFRLWLRKSWERQLRLAPTEYETNYSEAGLIK